LCIFLCFLCFSSSIFILTIQAQEDSWTSLAPMKVDRYGLGVVSENGKIYAMGGYNGGGPYLDANEEYDPKTNTWTNKTSMPIPMGYFGLTVHNGKIYCFSGENGATYAYTPLYDIWEEKTPLPNPRIGITANTVNDKIYIIGGDSNSTDVYDPIYDSWDTKAAMPNVLGKFFSWTCTSAVLNNRIHVFGASSSQERIHNIYSPQSDSWSIGESMLASTIFSVAVSTTGINSPNRIYVFGADRHLWTLNTPDLTSQSYDPKTENWMLVDNVPLSHLKGGIAVINDKLYLVGGGTAEWSNIIRAENNNDLYTPIGYGNPDPSYVPSDPTPTPTLSPTPTPSSSPTSTPELEPFPTTIVIASVIIIAIVGLGIFAYFKKIRGQ